MNRTGIVAPFVSYMSVERKIGNKGGTSLVDMAQKFVNFGRFNDEWWLSGASEQQPEANPCATATKTVS